MRLRFWIIICLVVFAGTGAISLCFPTASEVHADEKSDFAKTAVPFVTMHCVSCHGPNKKKADLTLHNYQDEASILKDRKKWQLVLQMVHGGEMPPESRPRPSPQETEAFTKVVQAVFAKADSGMRDPGRVTMRRLNRTEYNNTIRDLVGVDFQPAEDFPSDDVGYGFDNIGDVLTLSPILMERYLGAAEAIMQRAIVVNLPKPTVRTMNSRYLEPAISGGADKVRFRSVLPKGKLHTPYKLNEEGDFKLRVRAYAVPIKDEKIRMAIEMDGKTLKTFDVEAGEKQPATFEVPVHLDKGNHRAAALLLNDFEVPKDTPHYKLQKGLFVESIALEGPLDTRPLTHQKIMAHKPGLAKKEATREIITRFTTKAYRRPATIEEVNRLVAFVEKAETRGEKWEAGIQLALQAVLISPKFLFRVELDAGPAGAQPHPLDDYQLASRLSYFLWSTMPDDQLLALAKKQSLKQNLDAQIKRMLKDPKAGALVENFAAQWLQLGLLKNVAPDPKLFPDFDESLRVSMRKETLLFFENIMLEDRSILDLIDADYTFLNDRLARHYGFSEINGKPISKSGRRSQESPFQKVKLTDGQRGGILTQASILTITSNPTRTSPVKRGRWVLDQILGTPPPPPPPDVPELVVSGKTALTGTLRQQMEQHRANPSCAACHARMDPIGFGFENFNAIGMYRAKDGDFPVDASGTLPSGQSFKGAGELKAILKGKTNLFGRCLTEKMLTYALGRGLEYYDTRVIDGIVAALAKNDYRFATLITEIIKSEPFRLRRGNGTKG